MITIDDEEEGGVLANDDVITKTTIFGKFLGFFQNFPKNLQNLYKNFQLSEEIFTEINVILFLWHHIRGYDLCQDSGTFLQSFIGLVG